MQKGSVNIRALFLHNLSDALASVAVILGGTLILLYDMRWVDPAITIGIALYILYLAFSEIGGPVRTLMLGSPPDLDGEAVVSVLRSVDGVADIHHVHLWLMEEHAPALDTHVVVKRTAWDQLEDIKRAIKQTIEDKFGITHSTLEFEREDQAHQSMDLYGHGSDAEEEADDVSGNK
jgi:cobalt-zinc-cadmium efflux system protein